MYGKLRMDELRLLRTKMADRESLPAPPRWRVDAELPTFRYVRPTLCSENLYLCPKISETIAIFAKSSLI